MPEKNQMTNITSAEYSELKYSLPKLKALVEALAGMNARTVPTKEARASITVFEAEIRQIYINYTKFVEMGDEQYQQRDKDLINKATTRLFEIPSAINLLEVTFKSKIRACEHKAKALREQGLTEAEITEVNKPITDADREELANKIKALRDEETALHAYIGDAPCYDIELLKNTPLYPETSGVV